MITWRPIEGSSNVAQVGWPANDFAEAHLLLVRFKDGRCYGYVGASRQMAVYLATRCPSVGTYVNTVLKKRFKAVRIPDLDVNGPPF